VLWPRRPDDSSSQLASTTRRETVLLRPAPASSTEWPRQTAALWLQCRILVFFSAAGGHWRAVTHKLTHLAVRLLAGVCMPLCTMVLVLLLTAHLTPRTRGRSCCARGCSGAVPADALPAVVTGAGPRRRLQPAYLEDGCCRRSLSVIPSALKGITHRYLRAPCQTVTRPLHTTTRGGGCRNSQPTCAACLHLTSGARCQRHACAEGLDLS
jgi:hypothetical protein